MFPVNYFCNGMFTPNYFPKTGGSVATPITLTYSHVRVFLPAAERNAPAIFKPGSECREVVRI